jgi:hypothetical protein
MKSALIKYQVSSIKYQARLKIAWFLIAFLLLNTGYLILNTSFANAQTSRGFTVSPPSLKFSLKPGERTERKIKITNQSAEKMDFSVYIEDFVVTNKEGTPELLPPGTLPQNRYAASTWSTALPDSFSLGPGKSVTVSLYIQVPENASPGGRYFAVAFKPLSGLGTNGAGAAVNTVIGTLIYLTIEGAIQENARMVAFSAPAFLEFGPVEFLTEIRNLGNLHLAPRAVIKVRNLLGKEVFSFSLDNLNIFPGTARIYKNSWEQKWLLGRYTASLTGYYGQNNALLAAQTIFWVIPYRLILIILLALTIITLVLVYLKKEVSLTH